jgi:hypothetical protein
MMHRALLVVFFLSSINSIGQVTFQKTYSYGTENEGFSIRQTSDGGYIIGGNVGDYPEDVDACLIKTDSFGNTEWIKHYGGTGIENCFSVIQTSDGGYAFVGRSDSLGNLNGDVYFVKTDANGGLTWSRTYDIASNDFGRSVVQTADGGYIICGEAVHPSFNASNLHLIKTDANGNVQWSKSYYQTFGVGTGQARSVIQTSDGNYMVSGWINNGAGLMKTDTSGNVQWVKIYQDSSWSTVSSEVQETMDGGYIAVGYTFRYVGQRDFFVVRTDGSGDSLWTKTISRNYSEEFNSVKCTPDSGFIVCGSTVDTLDSNYDIILMKINSQGAMQWSREFNFGDLSHSVCLSDDGGFTFAGGSSYLVEKIYFVKTDNQGATFCMDSAITLSDESHAIVASSPLFITDTGMVTGIANTIETNGGVDSSICFFTGIASVNYNLPYLLYPNPAHSNSQITFTYPSSAEKKEIIIHSIHGKELVRYALPQWSSTQTVKLPQMAAGVYVARLVGEETSANVKFVVE